jgi:hypothetical protein
MCPTGDILFPIRSASWTPVFSSTYPQYEQRYLKYSPQLLDSEPFGLVIILHEECSKSAWLIHVHATMSAAWGENDISLWRLTHSPDQYCSADVVRHLIVLHRASPAVPCKNISHIQV